MDPPPRSTALTSARNLSRSTEMRNLCAWPRLFVSTINKKGGHKARPHYSLRLPVRDVLDVPGTAAPRPVGAPPG